jgi:DNA-binding SARP family transcriptional activator
VRIALLGAVEVWPDGSERRPVSLSGLRLRGLLARLALDGGRPVAVSELVDDLWGDAPPDGAANALQALVSRLRRAFGADLVDTAARGCRRTAAGSATTSCPSTLARPASGRSRVDSTR